MLPRIEKRSDGTIFREEARLGWEEREVVPVPARGKVDPVPARGKVVPVPARGEVAPVPARAEELLTGSGSGSKGLRLPEREAGFLDERCERVIGMAKLLYCFLPESLHLP